MKGAIASVEIFVAEAGATEGQRRRLTLTVTAPERADDGGGWMCRVALADLHRPTAVTGLDSVTALGAAIAQARAWLDALDAQGATLFRDRKGKSPFQLV